MNHDELAFANLQLAGMLREGIPLEGAIRQVAREMQRGDHKTALLQVEAALAGGAPLAEAVETAKLPEFYREMIRLGAASGDLPGALTLAADYYRRVGAIWTRLRALLTYPLLTLLVSLALSIWFALLFHEVNTDLARQFGQPNYNVSGGTFEISKAQWWLNLWAPTALMTGAAAVLAAMFWSPGIRSRLRWRVAPFRDASLAQLAAALSLLLRQGVTFRDSLAFVARLENSTRAGQDLRLWMDRHAQGHAHFSQVAEGSTAAPSLFIWIVSSARENLAEGFAQAAELYAERARRRAEILLNMVLPCALLAMGLMIMGQIYPFATSVFDIFTPIFNAQQLIRP